MKKHLFLTSILLLALFSCGHSRKEPPQNDKAIVVVCTGQYAERYHDHKCSGLNNCKGEIRRITLAEAKKKGYTPCKRCYKR